MAIVLNKKLHLINRCKLPRSIKVKDLAKQIIQNSVWNKYATTSSILF